MADAPEAGDLHADGLEPVPVPPPTALCPNCGSARIAAFCADCGQDQESPRKRWREHLEELTSTYTELDSKTLRSFGTAVARPGTLTEIYLENRSGDYVTPLKLFLIVVVLHSIFFAISPIKYGQFQIALETEWDPEYAEDYAPDEWGHSILMYAPETEDSFSPGFRASLADGTINPAALPGWVAEAASDAEEMEEIRGWSASILIYLPLCIIPVFVLINGFLFRRRYLLFDHVFLALEAASVIIMIIMATGAVTWALAAAGVTLGEATPYLLGETPLVLLALTLMIRRFYRIGAWRAFGTAFLVLLGYLVAETAIYYPAIEIIGRLV